MLKSELIEILAQENPHLSAFEVERVIAVFFESITQTLQKGARVEIRGFGSFTPRHRKSRFGRNPRTGARIRIDEKYVPFFRAGKDISDKIDASRKNK